MEEVKVMSSISVGKGECIKETKGALLVQFRDGEEKWIPKSVIHDDSEVYKLDTDGDVVVQEWWADEHI